MDTDKTNSKVVTVAFVITAFLAHLVTRILFETLGATFSAVENVRSMEAIRHGVPLAVAAGVFLSLQLNKKVLAWADEVLVEVRKIVWPSRKDTVAMTVVVCIMVVVAGLGLSVIDYFSSQLIKLIVN